MPDNESSTHPSLHHGESEIFGGTLDPDGLTNFIGFLAKNKIARIGHMYIGYTKQRWSPSYYFNSNRMKKIMILKIPRQLLRHQLLAFAE